MPSLPRFTAMVALGLAILGMTALMLGFCRPPTVTAKYEVLEPKTWIGKQLPILEHIDIADQLKQGAWLLLLYHHDCPDCQKVIREYARIARLMQRNQEDLRIALIEVPPYGPEAATRGVSCLRGQLTDAKEWFVKTPITVKLLSAKVYDVLI